MAGDIGVAKWIAEKLRQDDQFTAVEAIGSGFLQVTPKEHMPFVAVAVGVRETITQDDVKPLFSDPNTRAEFVVNVPSKAIWRGDAIDVIHAAPAAFGTLGDLVKAAREEPVSSYRNKEYNFFDRAFRQHRSVKEVIRVYDRVYLLLRGKLPDITVTLIDAYDMSAEDIRNAYDTYGRFDAAVKTTSYGSITSAASEAATNIGAEAFKFRDLMARLYKP